jgi:hypothetical protein
VEEVGQKKIKTQDTTRYLFLDHSRIGAKKHRLSRPSTMSHQVHELNLSSSLCVSSSVWGCTSSGEQLQNINNKCPSYPCFSTKNGEKVKRRKRFLFLGGKMGREAGQALVVEKKMCSYIVLVLKDGLGHNDLCAFDIRFSCRREILQ